ncbi:hypothetical protein HBH70_033740 [Parastagonospora nodorum]|nr:hypothetical protein HBI79_058810 [Parastagonospora nodorum]KAH5028223.1 hypothetical protein HBI74_118160 [Parastagonospora nodorum]KAH5148973.1 hypothetical protein HBH70_033740 [Parastagonospora nodorum]KAH5259118.1 hypothetical protein HBI72_119750 [Parastagonospora nodorum]KAH5577913.1 hypothetical protein HBI26_135640 [Parastagonospora nodorum]
MVGDTSFLDYENMIKRAESIARALRSNGCAKGSVVATYQERNPDWICSVLGIWHAGAIYLPLDIGLPASRLVAIVHHCEPRFVLRQGETIDNMVQEAFTCRNLLWWTSLSATPSEYSNWLRYGDRKALSQSLPHWRTALTGGEVTTQATLELFTSLGEPDNCGSVPRYFNVYGPTETTIGASGTLINYLGDSVSQEISAGKPLAGYLVYVVDDNLQPVPVGVQGEIVIGGAGVGGGYLKNPALSSQVFIPNIRAPQSHRARGWNMMHRTGDVGRWRKDGNLLVEGRKSGDTQIKLRGLRIDLAEVENSMLKESQAMLEQVVVSVRYPTQPRAQSGGAFLVAHSKFQPNVLASRGEQQTFLNKALAWLSLLRYMRPAAAFPVEHFPMLVSGKPDCKAVAKLPLEQEGLSSVGNTQTVSDSELLTKTEERLKRLWVACTSREISKQYTIDSGTDFFHVGKIDPSDKTHSGSGINIDWSAETDVPNAIQKSLLSAKAVDFMTTRTIILIGATGFLGQAYLKALLSDSKVTAVHCVAVRLGSAGTKRLLSQPDSLLHHSKVEIHAGDLAEPRLKLAEETITRIFGIADCIIHNGADTSHMKSCTSIRKTNYESTQELIKMCLGKNF